MVDKQKGIRRMVEQDELHEVNFTLSIAALHCTNACGFLLAMSLNFYAHRNGLIEFYHAYGISVLAVVLYFAALRALKKLRKDLNVVSDALESSTEALEYAIKQRNLR